MPRSIAGLFYFLQRAPRAAHTACRGQTRAVSEHYSFILNNRNLTRFSAHLSTYFDGKKYHFRVVCPSFLVGMRRESQSRRLWAQRSRRLAIMYFWKGLQDLYNRVASSVIPKDWITILFNSCLSHFRMILLIPNHQTRDPGILISNLNNNFIIPLSDRDNHHCRRHEQGRDLGSSGRASAGGRKENTFPERIKNPERINTTTHVTSSLHKIDLMLSDKSVIEKLQLYFQFS